MIINFNKSSTNWKYILITIILASIVGGILIYQYLLFRKEIKLPIVEIKKEKIKPVEKKEFIEIPLNELKEGENKIRNIIIKKITPLLLCHSGKAGSLKEMKFIGYEYQGVTREQGYYEAICNIENKAKVKIVGWESPPFFTIETITITDAANNIINEHDGYFTVVVSNFHYNDKTYFLIEGASGGTAGITEHFLYRIDNNGDIKIISSWGCEKEEYGQPPFRCKSYYEVEYVLIYKDNLYLKVGNEIWEFDENDVIKNKFPANKIIIKNGEISFQ